MFSFFYDSLSLSLSARSKSISPFAANAFIEEAREHFFFFFLQAFCLLWRFLVFTKCARV
jgi:hypothetical protein